MTDTLRSNIITALVAMIVVGTAYGFVADVPERKVVDIHVNMTTDEYAQALERARKQGEEDMLKRVRACDWRDTFSTEPPMKGRM
jgi:hypothetical protein